jgi:hypothetical protein
VISSPWYEKLSADLDRKGPVGTRTMDDQLDIAFPPPPPVTIPGQYDGKEPVFGDVCPPNMRGCTIATDEYRYLKDSTGKQTSYIRRTKGRPVRDIAVDLHEVIKDMPCYEWATLGQAYKYSVGADSPSTECPAHDGLVVYVKHGGSEGHLVCVEMVISPNDHGKGPLGWHSIHKTLFMVKTLSGIAAAKRISNKLTKALGLL